MDYIFNSAKEILTAFLFLTFREVDGVIVKFAFLCFLSALSIDEFSAESSRLTLEWKAHTK